MFGKAQSPGSMDRCRSSIRHNWPKGGVEMTLRFASSRNKTMAINNNEVEKAEVGHMMKSSQQVFAPMITFI